MARHATTESARTRPSRVLAATAVLFPGQGSQTTDMRAVVERYRPELLEIAHAEVGADLFERVAEGTRWAQPAIYCASLAGWEALGADLDPGALAGHSLGEISALAAGGALSAEDGLRLVAARGRLMQEAAERTGDGAMTAVRAHDAEVVEDVASVAGVAVANYNAPDQIVLSGAVARLDRAEADLAERGIRAKRLPVSGAFHSPLMEPAVEPFRDAVKAIAIAQPRVPVLSCVTAEPFDDVAEGLVAALTSPVRWTEVLDALQARGATRFVETGPGRVLTGLVRKTLDGVEADAPPVLETARA